jgi:hypothetical protein
MLLTWFALTASVVALGAIAARSPRAIPIRVRVRDRRSIRVVRRD